MINFLLLTVHAMDDRGNTFYSPPSPSGLKRHSPSPSPFSVNSAVAPFGGVLSPQESLLRKEGRELGCCSCGAAPSAVPAKPQGDFKQQLENIRQRLDHIGEHLEQIARELEGIGRRLQEIGEKIEQLQYHLEQQSAGAYGGVSPTPYEASPFPTSFGTSRFASPFSRETVDAGEVRMHLEAQVELAEQKLANAQKNMEEAEGGPQDYSIGGLERQHEYAKDRIPDLESSIKGTEGAIEEKLETIRNLKLKDKSAAITVHIEEQEELLEKLEKSKDSLQSQLEGVKKALTQLEDILIEEEKDAQREKEQRIECAKAEARDAERELSQAQENLGMYMELKEYIGGFLTEQQQQERAFQQERQLHYQEAQIFMEKIRCESIDKLKSIIAALANYIEGENQHIKHLESTEGQGGLTEEGEVGTELTQIQDEISNILGRPGELAMQKSQLDDRVDSLQREIEQIEEQLKHEKQSLIELLNCSDVDEILQKMPQVRDAVRKMNNDKMQLELALNFPMQQLQMLNAHKDIEDILDSIKLKDLQYRQSVFESLLKQPVTRVQLAQLELDFLGYAKCPYDEALRIQESMKECQETLKALQGPPFDFSRNMQLEGERARYVVLASEWEALKQPLFALQQASRTFPGSAFAAESESQQRLTEAQAELNRAQQQLQDHNAKMQKFNNYFSSLQETITENEKKMGDIVEEITKLQGEGKETEELEQSWKDLFKLVLSQKEQLSGVGSSLEETERMISVAQQRVESAEAEAQEALLEQVTESAGGMHGVSHTSMLPLSSFSAQNHSPFPGPQVTTHFGMSGFPPSFGSLASSSGTGLPFNLGGAPFGEVPFGGPQSSQLTSFPEGFPDSFSAGVGASRFAPPPDDQASQEHLAEIEAKLEAAREAYRPLFDARNRLGELLSQMVREKEGVESKKYQESLRDFKEIDEKLPQLQDLIDGILEEKARLESELQDMHRPHKERE